MPLMKVDAIVLRTRELGEADRIVTLYSKQKGKVQLVAKGVKKPKSKLVGGILNFTHAQYWYYQGRGLGILSQYDIHESFQILKSDLKKYAYATYMAELVQEFTLEGEENEGLFLTFLTSLHLLKTQDLDLATRLFEMRLLRCLGYGLSFQTCRECEHSFDGREQKKAFFSPALGGILCERCISKDSQGFYISWGTVKILIFLLKMPIEKISVLRVSSVAKKEMEKTLHYYLTYILEKKIKSKEFMHRIEWIDQEG